MPAIELQGITRSYPIGGEQLLVLRETHLVVEEGEFVAIMGPSGSGKSTLMQILGLLDRPSSGVYRLFGRDVSRLSDDEGAALRSRAMGFVFQMFNLLPRTSALDNVILPMVYSGQNHRQERGRELLREVGLESRMDHMPNQLSGGQQQRVAVARALVNCPRILFADEPTGNLATGQAEEVLGLLAGLNRQGVTIILVTHEPEIAACARRIIRLRDGVVVSDEENAHPRAPAGAPAEAGAPRPPNARSPDDLRPRAPGFAEFKEHLVFAWRGVGANKARTGLSALGVLIGVGAVIAMMAVGAGARESIQARLASLGSNLVMLFAGAPSARGIRGAVGDASRLTLEDAKAIQRETPGVADLYPEAEGNVRVVYKDRNAVTEMQGVTPNYASIRNAAPSLGRFFTEAEDMGLARVVLLAPTVARELFGDQDPVGETVKINRISFNVIGLLPSKGSNGFSDQDDMIVVPIRTSMRRVLGVQYLHEMALQCASPDDVLPVIDEVKGLMRRRHRLPALQEDDFTLRNMASAQAALSGATQTLSLFLSSVAAISLFVGGVGIMNIMLVSVNERTREIGLRKAVGAPRRAVLAQFLLESSMVSLLGGTLGVLLGCGVSFALTRWAGWMAEVTASSILTAFVFSAGVGVVFGFWPAYRASLLSPLQALRYE